MHICWANVLKFYKMHGTYIKILVCKICLVTLGLVGLPDDVTEECRYLVLLMGRSDRTTECLIVNISLRRRQCITSLTET